MEEFDTVQASFGKVTEHDVYPAATQQKRHRLFTVTGLYYIKDAQALQCFNQHGSLKEMALENKNARGRHTSYLLFKTMAADNGRDLSLGVKENSLLMMGNFSFSICLARGAGQRVNGGQELGETSCLSYPSKLTVRLHYSCALLLWSWQQPASY
ncbi:hypothetical protein [Pseudomonas chlororaphis]|uniref:hypothetical protein n=1 Tax=Pseudomonas chlororaphis TaxID=587753 RepID=UPI001FF0CEC6|nr:hypothetical protein [Pseudomonas chlororaphis]